MVTLRAPVAQSDRASDFESAGRPFESGRAHHKEALLTSGKGFSIIFLTTDLHRHTGQAGGDLPFRCKEADLGDTLAQSSPYRG
jgi:hypothetical protein